MKKILITVIAVSLFLLCIHAQKRSASLLDGIVIVLDAGHGGKDAGASCVEGNEAEVNLAIVKKLEKNLSQYGAEVVLTRDGDYDLASEDAHHRKQEDLTKRVQKITETDADLFFSIHLNSFPSTEVRGIQLFYQKANPASQNLCDLMHIHLSELSEHMMKDKPGDYYVLNESKVPSLLIECGFLSNAQDRTLLFQEDYQQKLAEQMTKAMLDYFSFYY